MISTCVRKDLSKTPVGWGLTLTYPQEILTHEAELRASTEASDLWLTASPLSHRLVLSYCGQNLSCMLQPTTGLDERPAGKQKLREKRLAWGHTTGARAGVPTWSILALLFSRY